MFIYSTHTMEYLDEHHFKYWPYSNEKNNTKQKNKTKQGKLPAHCEVFFLVGKERN